MTEQPDLARQGYVKVPLSEGGHVETLWVVRVNVLTQSATITS